MEEDSTRHRNVIQLQWWQTLAQYPNSLQKQRVINSFEIDHELPDNRINTSKYSFLTFLPKNLIQQFTKPANLYFLIIGVFQILPAISSTNGIPTMYIPLSIIVVITAIKDLYEDYKRSVSDNCENQQNCIRVLQEGDTQQILSKQIRVGMVVKVLKNQQIPCDGLIVYSPNNFAYVETKSLDGETNLKRKTFLKEINQNLNRKSEIEFTLPQMKIQYEKPNTIMSSFKGFMTIKNKRTMLSEANVLLRGSKLKNTEFVYLLALYTGHDTKILLCMNSPSAKRSSMETKLSRLILFIFISVILLSVVLAFINMRSGKKNLILTSYNPATLFFIRVMSWILNLTNLVPISLIVTVEAVKLFEGKIISNDRKMANAEFAAMVNSSNLIEDLGVIELVASDKTGTLTKNQLTLRVISDGEMTYNEQSSEIDGFILKLLGICHEAYVSTEGEVQSMSQDEISILKFLKNHQVELKQRGQFTLTLEQFGLVNQYVIHHTIQFTSERKKQSTIFETPEGDIYIVTKGADGEMDKIITQSLMKQQVFNDVNNFANKGYRTLVVAYKELQKDYIRNWLKKYKVASYSGNTNTMRVLEKEIEDQLEVLCATGVEDELQDEVCETIRTIIEARIKFIIISGDKPETVLSIAKNLNISQPFLAPTNEFKEEYLQKDLVVFARCTPRQKEEIVRNISLKTLAVGDGANDVSMITKATIGVGIAGKEGKAAVQSSDFAIPQFKYLRRLLFFHGREFNRRNAELVKYNFYKNFLYTFPQITFGFFSGFTAVYIYQTYLAQLFNLLFTSVPIMVFALFDESQIEQQLMINEDNLYNASKKEIYFSNISIFSSLLEAILQGIVSSYISFNFVVQLYRSPNDLSIIQISSILMLYVVIYANFRVILMTRSLTIAIVVSSGLGVALYFISFKVILYFATDISREQYQLFVPKSGVIIFGCIIVSIILTVILEFVNQSVYKYKQQRQQGKSLSEERLL